VEKLVELVFMKHYSNRFLCNIFWIVDVVQVPILVTVVIGVNLSDPCVWS